MTATVLILVQDGSRNVTNVATYANSESTEVTFAEDILDAAVAAAKGANREIEKHLRKLSEATH